MLEVKYLEKGAGRVSAFYIPMIIMWIVKSKGETPFRRFILPILSIISCLFMVFAAVYAHGIAPFRNAQLEGKFSFPVLFYLIVFAVVMGIGVLVSEKFKLKFKKEIKEDKND